MTTTEPIRSRKDMKRLVGYYYCRGELRNYLLVVLGLSTALRISDLLRLRWEDLIEDGEVRRYLVVTEKKTGKTRPIRLNEKVRKAIARCYPQRRSEYVFPNGRRNEKPISRQQAWRILCQAYEALKIEGRIGCHGLRKTLGYHASKAKTPQAVLMEIYKHSSWAVTTRYLGITQDEIDAVYLKVPLF